MPIAGVIDYRSRNLLLLALELTLPVSGRNVWCLRAGGYVNAEGVRMMYGERLQSLETEMVFDKHRRFSFTARRFSIALF